MALDPDEVVRSLEAHVEAQTQRALQLSAELESAEVSVRSPNGEVTVRVNSAGGLAGLEFHAGSDALSRNELAELVLATSRKAQARLAQRVGELVSGMYGASSSTTAFVTEAYTKKYPEPDDESETR